ncbi:MAG: hypothetical protein ACMUHB_02435, partial [Thermoplasmatota archaeon]
MRRTEVSLKLMLFISVFTLLALQIMQGIEGGNALDRIDDRDPPPRGITGHTEIVIGPDPAFFEDMSGLSNDEDIAFTLESNTPAPFHSISSSYLTGSELNGARTMATEGFHTFIGYIKKGSGTTWTSFWLVRYDTRSEYWDPPLEVYNVTGFSSSSCELLIHQGRIYLLMALISDTPAQSGLFVKHSSTEDWIGLVDKNPTKLDQGGSITRLTGMVGAGNSIVVVWKKETSGEVWETVFSDGGWSNPVKVLATAGTLALATRDVGGSRHILLFHTSSNGRSINLTVSTNSGVTWSSIINVNRTSPGSFVSCLSASEFNGLVNLLAVDSGNGMGIVYSSYNNLNWDSSDTVLDLTAGDPVDGVLEGQISSDRSQVIVSVESGGALQIFSSEDGGAGFELLAEMGMEAHCPVLTEEKYIIGFFEHGSLNLLRFEKEMAGSMRTVLLEPIGLSSWNDIGLKVDGFDDGCRLDIRVLDGSDDTQLFPGVGMEDVLSYPGGIIEGRPYDHKLPLTGSWREGAGLVGGVKLEIYVERIEGCSPAILSIALNHSSSLTFSENMVDPLHIMALSNCTITSSGVTLNDYKNKGEFIYGPVEMEDEWCDVIGMKASSQSLKVAFRLELRDPQMRTIQGYSFGDSVEMRSLTTVNYARWGTRYLKDLPDTVQKIYIAFRITSEEPTARPTVERVH